MQVYTILMVATASTLLAASHGPPAAEQPPRVGFFQGIRNRFRGTPPPVPASMTAVPTGPVGFDTVEPPALGSPLGRSGSMSRSVTQSTSASTSLHRQAWHLHILDTSRSYLMVKQLWKDIDAGHKAILGLGKYNSRDRPVAIQEVDAFFEDIAHRMEIVKDMNAEEQDKVLKGIVGMHLRMMRGWKAAVLLDYAFAKRINFSKVVDAKEAVGRGVHTVKENVSDWWGDAVARVQAFEQGVTGAFRGWVGLNGHEQDVAEHVVQTV